MAIWIPEKKISETTTEEVKLPWDVIADPPTIPDVSGKLDKTAYEVNRTIDFGNSGALYIGKFKVYDTNVTCEITSTTSVTYSGKLVIATQNYIIKQMTVYGDAANTVTPNIFVKPSSESDPYIEVYFKPASWSKNVVHIYGSAIAAEPTNVCTNVSAVPSTATLKPTNALNSKANLSGGNNWTGTQQFNGGSYYFATANDRNFTVEDEVGNAYVSINPTGLNLDPDTLGNVPFLIDSDAGASGQVLTSQGAGNTPIWANPGALQWVTPTSADEIVEAIMWRVDGDGITHSSGLVALYGVGSGAYGVVYSDSAPIGVHIVGSTVYMKKENWSRSGNLHYGSWKILKQG